ncbi:MAG: hypothetical protein NDJ89_05050 [Oligoflexia bacterium]|nr:hypothetical protein [Oligoflexia bacterium]
MDKLLLISSREEDVHFWGNIAQDRGLALVRQTGPDRLNQIRNHLSQNPKSFVLWEADASQERERSEIENLLLSHAAPERVFALSDGPINQQEGLSRPPAFGHHILRRYDGPASFIYSKLFEAALSSDPFGLERFFPQGAAREVHLKHSREKATTLGQVEEFLTELGLHSQIIRLGVEAADELLMNALFDAPFAANRGYYRRDTDRAESFPLLENEQVRVCMAANAEIVGISVTDPFGSLSREQVLKHLCQDLRFSEYLPPEGRSGAGLGLYRVNQQTVALLFSSKPGVKTEVSIFLSNSKSYREFRLGFCFFSILNGEA